MRLINYLNYMDGVILMSDKESKLNKIREILLEKDVMTKHGISEILQVSRVTTNSLIDELLESGEVQEAGKVDVTYGRPSVLYKINAEIFQFLLLSFCERNQELILSVKLIDGKRNLISEHKDIFQDFRLENLLQFPKKILKDPKNLKSIAISIPGKTIKGVVAVSWWDKFNGWDIVGAFENEFDVPTFVENDANLATIGFAKKLNLSSEKGIVGVHYPYGSRPGASIFYKNLLISGKGSLAGEVKYLPIFNMDKHNYTFDEEVNLLVEILILYTILIAPNYLLIHKSNLKQEHLQLSLNEQLDKTGIPVSSKVFVSEEFEVHNFEGLIWLAQQGVEYRIGKNFRESVEMKIKLILSDLDGTFLNSHGLFNAEYFETILNQLQEKNITFVVVTGKQTERVEELFGNLADKIWILGDSASRIKYKGSFQFESLIPNAEGIKIITALLDAQPDQTIIACTTNSAYIHLTRTDDEQLVRGSYSSLKIIEDFSHITEDFVKITVLDRKQRAFETFEKIKPYHEKYYVVASEASWIDITSKGVHKGSTVQKLQDILGVTKDETMAFGDGYNDLEMFEQAKFSYAMKNAFEEVKEKAFAIAPSNNENGVLKTIEKEILRK